MAKATSGQFGRCLGLGEGGGQCDTQARLTWAPAVPEPPPEAIRTLDVLWDGWG